MQVLYTRCAGLDVHKDTIVACVRCVSPPLHQEVRSFGSTTTDFARAGRRCRSSTCRSSMPWSVPSPSSTAPWEKRWRRSASAPAS